MSAAMAFVVFRGGPQLGVEAFNFDLLPQTLGVCIFTAVGVSFGARQRMAKGRLPKMERLSVLPDRLLFRIVVVTVAGLVLMAAPMALAFSAVVQGGVSFATALSIKIVYGAIQSAIVAALSVRAVMDERTSEAVRSQL